MLRDTLAPHSVPSSPGRTREDDFAAIHLTDRAFDEFDDAQDQAVTAALDEQMLLHHSRTAAPRHPGAELGRNYFAIRRSWMKTNARGTLFRLDEMTMDRWMLVWSSVMLGLVSLLCIFTAARLPAHRSSGIAPPPASSSTDLSGGSGSETTSRQAAGNDAANVAKMISTLLNPPAAIEVVENGMLWCAIASLAVAAMGAWHSWGRNRHALRVYLVPCLLVSLVALGYLFYATHHGYVTGDIRGVARGVREAWVKLALSEDGVQGLRVLSHSLSCTGYDMCCATNTTPVVFSANTANPRPADDADDEDDDMEGVDETWLGVCFATLPDGTLVDQTQGNITERVLQQCRYTMQDDTPNSQPLFATPCSRFLLGRITTSLSFCLTTLFTMASFCLVNGFLSYLIYSNE